LLLKKRVNERSIKITYRIIISIITNKRLQKAQIASLVLNLVYNTVRE